MWIGVVSLFPEMFEAITRYGVTGRAVDQGLLEVDFWNPRDYATDKHRTVDDRPYGGGPGMLMKVATLRPAIAEARRDAERRGCAPARTRVVYLSPQGRRLDQRGVRELADLEALIVVAGRYEGIDERVVEADIDEEWSIGDYVLSGGELPAMVMVDAVSRLVPGVLGHGRFGTRGFLQRGAAGLSALYASRNHRRTPGAGYPAQWQSCGDPPLATEAVPRTHLAQAARVARGSRSGP